VAFFELVRQPVVQEKCASDLRVFFVFGVFV
jgi:hypothetical protein